MFRADIGILEFTRKGICSSQVVFQDRREGNGGCFGNGFFCPAFFLETEFREAFFFKTYVFKENAPETAVFQKDCKKQMFWFDDAMTGIVGDFPRFSQAVPSMQCQFLTESCFEHS